MTVRPARADDLPAVLELWGGARSAHAVTEDTPERVAGVIDEFDRVVGLDRLGTLHVNDSKTPLGSNVDRHANLGDGELGRKGCAAYLSEPRFEGLPCLFEGPGAAGKAVEKSDIDNAWKLRKQGLRARTK